MLASTLVHLLTATGAVWGLLALDAIHEQRLQAAWLWMGIAVVVDAVDGPLARRLRVDRALPAIDGRLLDNLMDYVNYVLVPAVLLARSSFGLVAAAAVVLVSAFQFVHVDAKTHDHCFRGFPCYWNLVAFYLLLLRPAPSVGLGIVLGLCILTLVPLYYVHPFRTRPLRRLTLALIALWSLSLLFLGLSYPDPPGWLLGLSLLYPAYYFAWSLILTLRRDPSGSEC